MIAKKDLISKYLESTAIKFIIVGCISTSCDFIVYRSLLYFFSFINVSKIIGLSIGITVSYILNNFWAFQVRKVSKHSIFSFLILYIFSNGLNVLVNRVVLYFTGLDKNIYIILAFCLAAFVAATINYFGLKYFIFKK
ncbi:MAG: GtrA family protein [Deltaproteobacteria bacterium]|jgi:putative flippase GtrA|nr:GtrA family protein [Deltaproteobacteria bacterium]